MRDIVFPANLPKSKEELYIRAINNNYIKPLHFIHSLGNICMYDQFVRIYQKSNPQYTPEYADKKVRAMIKDMENMKLIQSAKLNSYKYFYLKKFAYAAIYNDYCNYKKTNMSIALKNNNFKINIMKVENYIKNNKIISNDTLMDQLLYITKKIYDIRIQDDNLVEYDTKILQSILYNKGIDECKDKIENLSDGNLIKVLWIYIYEIFKNLKLQNQTISKKPLYFNIYKKGSQLFLHYVPNIIIFDIHSSNYYIKKVSNLYDKFYFIPSNNVVNMQKNYLETNTLGSKGFNRIGYAITIIGSDNRALNEKYKILNSKIKENNYGIILKCDINYIDINKYFVGNANNERILDKIDSTFEELLNKKLNK